MTRPDPPETAAPAFHDAVFPSRGSLGPPRARRTGFAALTPLSDVACALVCSLLARR